MSETQLERALKERCMRYEHRIAELEDRLRQELKESFWRLGATRRRRYSSPEQYADAIFESEGLAAKEKP